MNFAACSVCSRTMAFDSAGGIKLCIRCRKEEGEVTFNTLIDPTAGQRPHQPIRLIPDFHFKPGR